MEDKGFKRIPVVDECNGCTKCSKPGCAGTLYALGLISMSLGENIAPQYSGILGCFSVFVHSRVRRAIRRQNKIQPDCCGDVCSDFCCALWCYSCAMAQERAALDGMQAPAANMFAGMAIPSAPPMPNTQMETAP
jgi:hypothetical protein